MLISMLKLRLIRLSEHAHQQSDSLSQQTYRRRPKYICIIFLIYVLEQIQIQMQNWANIFQAEYPNESAQTSAI